jgi:hypothetical protein
MYYCKHQIGRGRTWERPISSLSEDGRREVEDEEIELEAETWGTEAEEIELEDESRKAEAVVQGIFSLLTAVSNGSTSSLESSHSAGGLRMEQHRTGGMCIVYTSTFLTVLTVLLHSEKLDYRVGLFTAKPKIIRRRINSTPSFLERKFKHLTFFLIG